MVPPEEMRQVLFEMQRDLGSMLLEARSLELDKWTVGDLPAASATRKRPGEM